MLWAVLYEYWHTWDLKRYGHDCMHSQIWDLEKVRVIPVSICTYGALTKFWHTWDLIKNTRLDEILIQIRVKNWQDQGNSGVCKDMKKEILLCGALLSFSFQYWATDVQSKDPRENLSNYAWSYSVWTQVVGTNNKWKRNVYILSSCLRSEKKWKWLLYR